MNSNRPSERLLNFKENYSRKAQLLNEALTELAQNLFGLDSTEEYVQKIQGKMRLDRVLCGMRQRAGVSDSEIEKVLRLIETRAQTKEWNLPLTLIGA